MKSLPPDLQRYGEETQRRLEENYLQYPDTEPWRQSGMSGPWTAGPICGNRFADCVDRDGSFLDCAAPTVSCLNACSSGPRTGA